MMVFTLIILLLNILGLAILIFNYREFKKGREHGLLGLLAKIIIPFVSIYCLYAIGVNYNKLEYTSFDWIKLIKNTFSTFGFDIDKSIVSNYFNDNLLYKLICIIAFIYAIGTVYYTIISQFTNVIGNYIGVRLALRKDCDILIGLDEFESYKINNKNLIVWLDKTASKDDERLLMANNIHYIKKSFTAYSLNKLRMKKNGKASYHFISFQSEQKNLAYTSEFKKFLDLEYKNKKMYQIQCYYIHAEIGIDNLVTIQNKILQDKKEFSPFINFFNRFELTSLKFNEEYPITKYISHLVDEDLGAIYNDGGSEEISIDYIDSRTNEMTTINVKNEYSKAINVIYLGYGRSSREIHRGSIMNNQLVSIDKNNKLSNHLINYFAFDKNSFSAEYKNNIYYQNRFENNKDEYDKDTYYERMEPTSRFYPISVDINTNEFYYDIIKIAKMNNSYTSIVISLAEDLDNIDYALKLVQLFKQLNISKYHLFVRIKEKNQNTIELLNDDNITFFGWKQSVLNHDVIVNDDLLNLAKMTSKKYSEKNKSLLYLGWYNLSPIKQKSNIYANLNIRVKLNLIGYDYDVIDSIADNEILLEEIENKLIAKKDSYDDYLFFNKKEKPCLANIISFQEHSRWNSFYIGNGYVPLPKNDIKLIEYNDNDGNTKYRMYKDNDDLRMHACLTTYQDLDNYHRDYAKILCSNKKYCAQVLKLSLDELDKLSDEEVFNRVITLEQTYQYDYNLIESFGKIFKNSKYKLKKLNK